MKAEVKSYQSPDILNFETYKPETKEFSFLLRVLVGVQGEEGEESFDVLVCSPQWIASRANKDGLVFGYHKLIIEEYDFSIIKSRIEKYIGNLSEDNWQEIASKINLIGLWEFFYENKD